MRSCHCGHPDSIRLDSSVLHFPVVRTQDVMADDFAYCNLYHPCSLSVRSRQLHAAVAEQYLGTPFTVTTCVAIKLGSASKGASQLCPRDSYRAIRRLSQVLTLLSHVLVFYVARPPPVPLPWALPLP